MDTGRRGSALLGAAAHIACVDALSACSTATATPEWLGERRRGAGSDVALDLRDGCHASLRASVCYYCSVAART